VIDHRSARFAVGLDPIPSAEVDVKLGKRLRLATSRTAFHSHSHPFDINIDIDMALQRRRSRDEFVTMRACGRAL
jgi:hypothetical protein